MMMFCFIAFQSDNKDDFLLQPLELGTVFISSKDPFNIIRFQQ